MKERICWGTSMRNPRTETKEEYVGVIAATVDELEAFYNAVLPNPNQPFNRKKCKKIRVSEVGE